MGAHLVWTRFVSLVKMCYFSTAGMYPSQIDFSKKKAMQSNANTVEDYLDQLPEDRKLPMVELRNALLNNLPRGFSEVMQYGMISYVVPHSVYPNGYHCNPAQPLSFISIASQKNFIAVYHMGIYADQGLLNWFMQEYKKQSSSKLDMGKSCIRFKKINAIPYLLIGELATKMTVEQWIDCYETQLEKANAVKRLSGKT